MYLLIGRDPEPTQHTHGCIVSRLSILNSLADTDPRLERHLKRDLARPRPQVVEHIRRGRGPQHGDQFLLHRVRQHLPVREIMPHVGRPEHLSLDLADALLAGLYGAGCG